MELPPESTRQKQQAEPREGFAFTDLASVVALSNRKNPLGRFLRGFPDWMLRAADHWAEQDFDTHCRDKTPWEATLPLPDPWKFLLDAPPVTPEAKRVCGAARSWLFGLQRLCRLATGFATLNTDWYEEIFRAKAAGDLPRYYRALDKMADKFVLSRSIQEDVRRAENAGLLADFERRLRKRRAQIVHRPRNERVKSEAFDPVTDTVEIERQFRFEYLLVQQWLCFPSAKCDLPGLMFWSNRAITRWLFALTKRDAKTSHVNFGLDHVKKTRQRLRLVPVSDKSPLVWDAAIKPVAGVLEITLLDRSKGRLFQGLFRPVS